MCGSEARVVVHGASLTGETGSTKPIVRYNSQMVSSLRQAKDVEKALREEQAERAARIAAMLDRWAAEDVSDEPEWDGGDIQPMTLRSSGGPVHDKPSR